MKYFLSNRGESTPPTAFLVELTNWVLSNNVFLFQDKIFTQCKGTSMGASFAPEYACLFLGLWEQEFVYDPQKNLFTARIKWWARYIDDIFLPWTGNQIDLLLFHKCLNSTNENIKLPIEFSDNKINFLDVTIYKGDDDLLHSTLFRKTTDRDSILNFQSFHPPPLKKNIAYGQFQCLHRICDREVDFTTQAQNMSQRFRERH